MTSKARDYNDKVLATKVGDKVYRYTSSCWDQIKDSKGNEVNSEPSTKKYPKLDDYNRQDCQFTITTIERMPDNGDKIKLTMLGCMHSKSVINGWKEDAMKQYFTDLQKHYMAEYQKEKKNNKK